VSYLPRIIDSDIPSLHIFVDAFIFEIVPRLKILLRVSGLLVKKTMVRKYGVESVDKHFIRFDTICNATQVTL
jgi:hypothetical protein